MSFRAVDLFCGSGGLSLELKDSGFDVVAAFDNWEVALETYRRNISTHTFQLDIARVEDVFRTVSKLEVDLIAGGPPCQDFSTAGNRVEGGKANLTVAFGDIVAECKPLCFLMENVPRTRLSDAYKVMKGSLEKSGYTIFESVLNACFYGVPQARKRFFAVGFRGQSSSRKLASWVIDKKSDNPMSVKEYLRSDINIEYYYRHPRNYSRRSVFSVHEPSPTVRGVNRPVPPGYAGNHLDPVHPGKVRALTSWERGRIQTFPGNWDWGGGNRNGAVEQQIGNAVPVKLTEMLAAGVYHALAAQV